MAGQGFAGYAAGCPMRIELDVERRPGNALNIEIGAPAPRCRLRTPDHWPAGTGSLRWLGSGGSPLVFSPCDWRECPLEPNHCACGHRGEHHDRRGCYVTDCDCILTKITKGADHARSGEKTSVGPLTESDHDSDTDPGLANTVPASGDVIETSSWDSIDHRSSEMTAC